MEFEFNHGILPYIEPGDVLITDRSSYLMPVYVSEVDKPFVLICLKTGMDVKYYESLQDIKENPFINEVHGTVLRVVKRQNLKLSEIKK